MERDRLSYGELIAGISAILLSYFMFFDWFGEEPSQEPALNLPTAGHSAWDALNYIPIVLLIAIVAALAVVTLPTNPVRKLPFAAHGAVAFLGSVSALLILLRIFDPPNFGSELTLFGTVKYEGTVQSPIFLALAAAAGVAFGGCLAMRGNCTVLAGPSGNRRPERRRRRTRLSRGAS